MKKFHWPLQRLLDVTLRREEALRAELAQLANKIARMQEKIARRKAILREALVGLAQQEVSQRLAKQAVFMRQSAVAAGEIETMRQQATELDKQRAAKTQEFMKARASRQTLEKLRDKAHERYLQELARMEQKQLDEAARIAFAREMIQQRLAGAGELAT